MHRLGGGGREIISYNLYLQNPGQLILYSAVERTLD